MMIKLAIIGAVLLAGGILFYPGLLDEVNLPAEAESVKDNVKKVRETTTAQVSTNFDKTVDGVTDTINDLKEIKVFPTAKSTLNSEAENLSEDATPDALNLPG